MSARLRLVQGGTAPPVRVVPPAPEGRLPPHDLDAEAAVLSACLLDPSAVSRVLAVVKPEYFFSDAHARIFQAVEAIATAHGAVDLVSVAAWLRDRGWLAQLGGAEAVARLADATPQIGHVSAHAKILVAKYRRRRAIAEAQLVAAEGYADVGDEAEWLDGLGARLSTAAGDDTGGGGSVSLGDAMAATFAELHAAVPGEITGYSTGLPRLDAITTGLHGGEVVLLKAAKKTGKTVICGQLAGPIANRATKRRAGVPQCAHCAADAPCTEHALVRRGALVLGLEGKVSDWSTRLACAHGRIDANRLRAGQATPEDLARLARAADHLTKLPILIDDRKDLTIAKLGIRVRAERDRLAERGVVLSLVVLDNVQLWPARDRDRKLELDTAMRGIMTLASAPDLAQVAWIVVSQVNADGVARDSGAALEAHADAIWLLTVDEDAEQDGAHAARIKVEAQRRGPPGIAPFWYYPQWTLFWDGG